MPTTMVNSALLPFEFQKRELPAKLLNNILQRRYIAIDTETDGLSWNAKVVGVSLAWGEDEGDSLYLPINHVFGENYCIDEVRGFLAEILSNKSIVKIFHAFPFDYLQLRKLGLEVEGPYHDTKLIAYLLNTESQNSLKALAEVFSLSRRKGDIKKILSSYKSFDFVDSETADRYARTDALLTYELFFKIFPRIREIDRLYFWYSSIELPLGKILVEMTLKGIKVDTNILKEFEEETKKEVNALNKEISKQAGEPLNCNSPQQLADLLYKKLKFSPPKLTSGKLPSTDKEALELLRGRYQHPILDLLVRYRLLEKIGSTYILPLKERLDKDNRIHTFFMQTATASGRLASENPNLQNIPKNNEFGDRMRKLFIADTNKVLIVADYNQIELKVGATLSGEKTLYQQLLNGVDIHKTTAERLFPGEEPTIARLKAKTINFGVLYGMSWAGLQKRLKCGEAEAKDILRKYDKIYPAIKRYRREKTQEALTKGYIETISGRRRYLDKNDPAIERKAINTPIQGSSADLIKIAMVQFEERLRKEGLKEKASLLLSVHDELVVECDRDVAEKVQSLLKESMLRFWIFPVPEKIQKLLSLKIKVGQTWGD